MPALSRHINTFNGRCLPPSERPPAIRPPGNAVRTGRAGIHPGGRRFVWRMRYGLGWGRMSVYFFSN
jgi:hypothetical protein